MNKQNQNQKRSSNNRSSFKEQLADQKGALLSKRIGAPLHASQWKGDGEDHINVSGAAKTKIGRWLNSRNAYPFQHPMMGKFVSIENLMNFIRAVNPDDRIRNMDDIVKVRNFIKTNGGYLQTVRHFRALVVHAIYVRVLLNEQLMAELLSNDLPFDSYSVDRATGLRQRFEPAYWICAGYDEIRAALKERRSPNLDRFIDWGPEGKRDGVDIYSDVMDRLTGGYNGAAPEVIAAFEAKRWAAYDKYLERMEQRNKKPAPKHTKDQPIQAADISGDVVVQQPVDPEVYRSDKEPSTNIEQLKYFNTSEGVMYLKVEDGDGRIFWISEPEFERLEQEQVEEERLAEQVAAAIQHEAAMQHEQQLQEVEEICLQAEPAVEGEDQAPVIVEVPVQVPVIEDEVVDAEEVQAEEVAAEDFMTQVAEDEAISSGDVNERVQNSDDVDYKVQLRVQLREEGSLATACLRASSIC